MWVSICNILNDMVHSYIQVSVPLKLNSFVCEKDLNENFTCSDSDSNIDSNDSFNEEEVVLSWFSPVFFWFFIGFFVVENAVIDITT